MFFLILEIIGVGSGLVRDSRFNKIGIRGIFYLGNFDSWIDGYLVYFVKIY